MFGKAQFERAANETIKPSAKDIEMLLKHITKVVAIAAVCLIASPVSGQTNGISGASTMLSVDGTLIGYVKTSEANVVTNAKVSLVSQGKVIDSVVSDDSGNFSFNNVNPGPYQIVGSSDGLVGAQTLHVGPYVEAANAAPTNVILQTSAQESVYDVLESAPVSACSTCNAEPVQQVVEAPSCGCDTCNTCNTCGGGGFGGLGGGGISGGGFGGAGLGGRLGGGLLSRPGRLLLAGGLIGGLAAIDGDDASPDN